uniref:Reverse transcriptase domain-containing protein n=1 Tax=Tanacetum cinerariifolium TaxID=118510 RepID=A0A6L2LK50_TANCI|nr:hypothetical protein [Tanacetum cinerariifolium]
MADRTMEELLQAPTEGGDFNKQEENLRRNLNNDMRSILGSFFQNQASNSGTLPSNTIPNLKGEMKAVTTRNGLAYEGPSIPTNSFLKKVVERETEETTDKEQPNCQGSTAHIQPPDALLLMPKFAFTIRSLLTNKDKLFKLAKVPLNENSSAMLLKKLPEKIGDPNKFLIPCDFSGMDRIGPSRPKGVAEDVFVKVGKFYFPTDFVVVDFKANPRVPLIPRRSFLRTGCVLIDVYGKEISLREYAQDVKYNSKSGNPTLVSKLSLSKKTKSEFCKEPIVKSSSHTLTPFGESDFLLEEIKDFLKDESIRTGIEDSCYDLEGDILYLKNLLNYDPSQLPPMDLKQAEETKAKSLIKEPPES